MKKSVSFSNEETESISLNFSELRAKGLTYIQELSGEVWTDFNAHDPGVTILEQLCYALTDVGYRTSFSIEDLLTPRKKLTGELFKNNNAFFPPATIFSSHPVTIADIRKIIIDQFDEIQNVWVNTKKSTRYEEQISGINQITIVPKLYIHNVLKSNADKKGELLTKVQNFLSKHRNLGEDFAKVCLLDNQNIHIDFEIHIDEHQDVDVVIANLFLALFEFMNNPVHYYSFEEMKEDGYSIEEIFSGPRLKKGFIKNDELKPKITRIHIDEFQKLFTKVKGIYKCVVNHLKIKVVDQITEKIEFEVDEDKFFHIDAGDDFEGMYANMKVFINKNKITAYNKTRIHAIFQETWSKKHREYHIGALHDKEAKGAYRNPETYHSIQNHFPIIYGIGRDGISKREPIERHAKALQLKAYLMFFEQHLANHLSQLGHIHEFFAIDFEKGKKQTYFPQRISSIPQIDKLEAETGRSIHAILEDPTMFFDRKNRIFNHLLARFGEDFSDLPWKVSLQVNLIKTTNEFSQVLLQKKSEFLKKLEKLNYERIKGASFVSNTISTEPSGLEQMVSAKTGIPIRKDTSLIPDFLGVRPRVHLHNEQPLTDSDIKDTYRHLSIDEIERSYKGKMPSIKFWEMDFKALFIETLKYENYRISDAKETQGKIDIIFRKEENTWVSLLECVTVEKAVQNIHLIIAYFINLNNTSEGLYILDHILLRDFLEGSQYGFSFIDEDDNYLFQTIEEESWCASEKERNENIQKFYEAGLDKTSYVTDTTSSKITDSGGHIIASYRNNNLDPITKDQLFDKNKSIIRLFNAPEEESGRVRLQEIERIRLYGSKDSQTKKQRRLVFQRKCANGVIVDEDFFNLNVSILFPNWPARFQDKRFNGYVADLIQERIPAHISNETLWLDKADMKDFEKSYHDWQQLKLASETLGAASEKLKTAAYDVYLKIKELRKIKH